MLVLGLTGSIAMGKSTVARIFKACDVPVFDADAAVHGLFRPRGAAVAAVRAAFPAAGSKDGGVDRAALGRAVFGDAAALGQLEAIVHPLIRRAERHFLARLAAAGAPLAVLDIPLLYETRAEGLMDAVIVVSAPCFAQRQRVLRRPGMTPKRLEAILARQLPDAIKRRRADFVISTGLDRRQTTVQVVKVLHALRGRQGRAWPACWPIRQETA